MMRDHIRHEIGFAQIPRWVIEHPELSDRAVRLYGVLHRWAGLPDGIVPGRKKLKALLRDCSVSSVDRALKELVGVGAIQVEKRWDEAGDPTSNLYILMSSPVIGGSRTHEATGSRTSDDQTIPTLNEKKPESPYTKEQHDGLWDEFERIFGTPIAGAKARYHYAAAAGAAAGITPGMIGPAVDRYQQAWDAVDCNPQALINNWHKFGPEAHLRNMPREIREALQQKGKQT